MKPTLILAAALLSLALAAPALADPAANKKAAEAFQDMVFNQKKVQQAFDLYVAPKYIQHAPRVPDGRDTAIRLLTGLTTKVQPEMTYTLKRALADGDLVVLHGHVVRRPGDRGQAFADFYRFENGKIAEHWDVMEEIPETLAHDNTMF